MVKPFKKLAAALNRVPYEIDQHWPPFYDKFYRGDRIAGCRVIPFDYDKGVGDTLPLLTGRGKVYVYKITQVHRAAGDDHIVSPLNFDLTYVRSVDL